MKEIRLRIGDNYTDWFPIKEEHLTIGETLVIIDDGDLELTIVKKHMEMREVDNG